MNTYYETFLRKDIFPNQQDYADIVINIYDQDETERHYIAMVLEDYIKGGSVYQAYYRLYRNIIHRYKWNEKHNSYLDDEFKNKMSERGC